MPTAPIRHKLIHTTILCGALALAPAAALANPHDGTVVGGSAAITQNGKTLDVHQSSEKTIIDWRGFDIAPDETTQFHQPSASAIALNRIKDTKPSQIDGKLKANGNVILINPNGVVFGAGAQVDVNGLVATTSDTSNEEFLRNDKFRFTQPGKADAAIVNKGSITAAQAGLVGFIAPQVENSGVIAAKLGKVQLASGDAFTLDMAGDGLTNVAVTGEMQKQLVANRGLIDAQGGQILLTAAAARSVVDSLVLNSGTLRANAFEQQSGSIRLYAQGKGGMGKSYVHNSGTIDASGKKGGQVELLADNVALKSGSRVNASGQSGGGSVKVGGDYQGKGGTPTAQNTVVETGSTITADALENGDGGRVIVWADDTLNYAGFVSARGGSNGGNGGFVETSGKNHLILKGLADTSAPFGNAGLWLIDPATLTFTNRSDGAADGVNTINASQLEGMSALGNVSLSATNNVTFDLATDNVVLTSGNSLTITSDTGNIVTSSAGTITASGAGAITLVATAGTINFSQDMDLAAGSGAVTLRAGTGVTYSGGGSVNSSGNVTLDTNALTLTSFGIQTTGIVTFKPYTPTGTTIAVGGAGSNLNITTAILAATTAGGIVIGDAAGTGAMTVSAVTAPTALTYRSGSGVISISGAQTMGAHNLTVQTGANLGIAAAITGTGTLTIGPNDSASTTVGIAGGAGTLALTTGELAFIDTGWTNLTFGNSTASGLMTVGNYNWANNVNFVNGAANISFSFGGSTSTLTSGKYLTATTTSGNIISGAAGGISVGGAGYITFTSGGSITVAHDFDLTATGSGAITLRANADINYSVNGGDITTTGGDIVLNSDRDADGVNGGAISLSGASGNNVILTSNGGAITLGGGANPVTTDAKGNATLLIGVNLSNARLLASGSTGGTINVHGTGYNGAGTTRGVSLSATIVTTDGAGNINIYGTTIGASTSVGMQLASSSSITTGSGNITIVGTSVAANGITWQNSSATSTSGDITIEGNANGTSSGLFGLNISGTGSIGGTSGDVLIDGYANGGTGIYTTLAYSAVSNGTLTFTGETTSSTNRGITYAGGTSEVDGGDLTINATGGGGVSAGTGGAYSMQINNGLIRSTGNGLLHFNMHGVGAGLASFNFNGGTVNAGNHDFSITTDGFIGLGATVTANNITFTSTAGAIGGLVAGTITSNGASGIMVNAATNINLAADIDLVATVASAPVTLRANTDIVYTNGGDITTNGGDITLNADRDQASSSGGSISITGSSGNNSIFTSVGGKIILGGGTTPESTSAIGTSSYTNGIYLTYAQLLSSAGNISLRGQGYADASTNNHRGVYLHTGALVQSTSGSITIVGQGGVGTGGNNGVSVAGSVTTVSGAITVTGTGVADPGIGANAGVGISGSITSTGTTAGNGGVAPGAITITGTGGNGDNSNVGVNINGANAAGQIASVDASITVTGYGGAGDTASGSGYAASNTGVVIVSAATGIISTGLGNVDITGTGHGAGGYGVLTNGGLSFIQSTDGWLHITGYGSTDGTDINNHGLLLNGYNSGSDIGALGTGNVVLTGVGGGTGGSSDTNYGILLGGRASANSGTMTLIGTAGTGSSSVGVFLNNTAAVLNSTSNTISVTGTGGVYIIGTQSAAGDYTISNTTGDITLRGTITADDMSVTNNGSGNISSNTAGSITANTLTVTSPGTLDFSTFTITTTGATNLTSAGAMTLSSITGSTIFARATGGTSDLTISSGAIITGTASGTAVTLVAGRNFINSSGAGALVASHASGRWLVYSTNVADDTIGGLVNDFRRFSCTYGGACPSFASSGNGLLYSTTPMININADLQTVTYGDAAPTYTYTVATGDYLGSDAAADVRGGAITYGSSYSAGSNVGSYAINKTGGALTSALGYGFTYNNNATGLTVNKATLNVTADNAGRTYGSANPSFTATITGFVNGQNLGTSGVTGAAALSTAANAGSAVGTYAIAAALGTLAASNYDFTFSAGTLTVNKATLTVTADNKTKTYGGANPTFSALISGFVNGETLGTSGVTGSAALSSAANAGSAVGAYAITTAVGSLAASNYDFSLVNGTLTIDPATLSIAADNKTKTYGDSNPALTYSISGWVNGDTEALLSGVSLATSATLSSNVGSYGINASGGTAGGNYTLAYTAGTLGITPAALMARADNKARTAGNANPNLTLTLTGLKSWDDVGIFTGYTLSTPANASSPIGAYAITLAGGTAGVNYTLVRYDGTMTVDAPVLPPTIVTPPSVTPPAPIAETPAPAAPNVIPPASDKEEKDGKTKKNTHSALPGESPIEIKGAEGAFAPDCKKGLNDNQSNCQSGSRDSGKSHRGN